MGGKLNQQYNLPEKRLNTEDYNYLLTRIMKVLDGLGIAYRTIDYYKTKESHGNLDLIINAQDPRKLIENNFITRYIHSNGKVCSFEQSGFQIDFINTPLEYFESTAFYYGAELGNFFGRIAHKMGFKLGERGLLAPVKLDNYQLEEIEITRNPTEILEFLGYDIEKYRKGFDALDDIFEFVESSSYFRPSLFLLENRNAVARKREIHRKTYMLFIERIKDRDGKGLYRATEALVNSKEFYWVKADKEFPHIHLLERRKILVDRAAKIRILRDKFNSCIPILNLSGAELGKVVSTFKKQFGDKDKFYDFVGKYDKETIVNQLLAEKYLQGNKDLIKSYG